MHLMRILCGTITGSQILSVSSTTEIGFSLRIYGLMTRQCVLLCGLSLCVS